MFSDSRRLSRTLAAVGLIAGPVLLLLSTLADPAWSDDSAEYLAEVADDKGLYILAGVLGSLGSLVLIPGMLGVARLFRERRVTLGQIGATLVTIGLIGLTAILAFNGFDIALADLDDRAAAVAVYDDIDENAAVVVYFVTIFFIGLILGSILLAIALFRRRIVPIWSPILLIVSALIGFIGPEEQVGSILSSVVLVAALFPLAQRIWGLSDDEWERWELPLAGETSRPAAPPPPPPPPPTEPGRI